MGLSEAFDCLRIPGAVDLVHRDDQARGRRWDAGFDDLVARTLVPEDLADRPLEHRTIPWSDGCTGVDDGDDQVDVADGVRRRLVQAGAQRGARTVDARGVDEDHFRASGAWSTPRIRCRVVLGRGEVMATLVPTMVLTSVDLPTFGRPTTATKPERMRSVPLCDVEPGGPARTLRPPSRFDLHLRSDRPRLGATLDPRGHRLGVDAGAHEARGHDRPVGSIRTR